VHNAKALLAATSTDPAVARHFAKFDFNKARIIQLTEPRSVYVSYRIRDTIFWTKRRIQLHAGEMLLTDGKITARTKCGNQVSDAAKPDISDEEPEEDVLDEPVALEPMGPSLPIRPQLAPPDLPEGQPIAPSLFANGFSFPYVPFAGIPAVCPIKDGIVDKKCKPHHNKPTPEPGTYVLVLSGLALVLWRYRATHRHPNPVEERPFRAALARQNQ
jgi:hypothetical protein